MKRRIIAVALAVAVAGSLSTAAIAFADDHGKKPASHTKTAQDDKADSEDTTEEDGDGAGGPPPWAHGSGAAKDDWKAAWHKLTPSQREARMSLLARQHSNGMKKWTTCVQKAGTDNAARAKCVRPLPPGLAKKQLAN